MTHKEHVEEVLTKAEALNFFAWYGAKNAPSREARRLMVDITTKTDAIIDELEKALAAVR